MFSKTFVDNHHANKTLKLENVLFEDYSDELLLFAAIVCIIFIIVGVPGNVLTITALSRGKQTRNSTAIFIMNLSCSDLLFGCFNLPLAASTFLKRAWVHGDLLCRLFPLLRYGLLAVSLFTVSLITINRYIIIAHPRQYPRIYQHRYVALMVIGTWITPISFMIPTWRGIWGKFGLDIEVGSCSILHDEYGRSPKEFLFVIAFLVPCVCIVLCYARIFFLVRKAAFRRREPVSATITTNKNISSFHTQESQNDSPKKCSTNNAQKNATKNKTAIENQRKVEDCNNIANCLQARSFKVDEEDIKYIDVSDSNDDISTKTTPFSARRRLENKAKPMESLKNCTAHREEKGNTAADNSAVSNNSPTMKTVLKTSFTRFNSRKTHYVSIGNTSNASSIYPGKMSQKDRRLLKMILVIFITFIICYLPITITKIWKSTTDIHIFNISGYLLVYLTTCSNPIIYVLMSLEYRQAYINLLRCQTDNKQKDFSRVPRN